MLQEAENKQEADILEQAIGLVKENQRLAAEKEKAEDEINSLAKFCMENPNPVLRIDENGVLLFSNPPALILLNGGDIKTGHPVPPEFQKMVALAHSSQSIQSNEITVGAQTFYLQWVPIFNEGYVNVYARNITIRKEAEKKLKQATRKNELILNSAGEGIYGLDLEGNTTFANPAAVEMLGYTEAELLGKPQHALIHHSKPDGSPYPREDCPIYAAFMDGREHRESEEVFWRKDGTSFPVEYASMPIREDGKLVGAVVTFKDITERKRSEQALIESETRANAVLNHAIEGIITIDEQGTIKSFNPAAETLFGYKPAEVLGKNVKLLMPEPFQSEHDQYLKNYISSGVSKIIGIGREVIGLRKDGSTFPLDLGISEMYLGETRMFTGIVRDMTERKKTEQALRESEIRANVVLNHALEGFVTIDEKGTIEAFNPAAEKLFGYTSAEILGENVTRLIPENFRQAHEQGLNNYLETGISKVIGIGAEVVGLRKDGSTFPLELGISEMYLGETRKFTGIIRDITERKKAEQALKESETRANEVLNHALEGIITIDEQGMIASFNPAAERLFGYKPKEVLRTNIKFLMPEPYQSEHDQYIKKYLETGVSKIIGLRREAVGLRKDGSTFPLDLGISEMYLGETRRFMGIIRDISDLKQGEAQKQMQYELTRIFLDGQSLENTFPRILQAIGEFMEWEIGYYWEKNPELDELHCPYTWNTSSLNENEALKEFKHISVNRTFTKGTGLPGRVWDKLEPSWISDVIEDTNFPRAPFAERLGMKSGFGFPVFFKKQFLGVIEIFTRQHCQPDNPLIQMMTHLGGQIGQWVSLKRAEEHLDKLNLKTLD
jgi:PAS domain S-box-containing protein